MNKLLGLIIGLIVSFGVVSSPAPAAGLPLVISATVDYTHNTLTINGQNFGSGPAVTLDALTFQTQGNLSSTKQVVANFPSGRTPSSFTPGTYFLTVTFKGQLPTIFTVDIGANGATGATGPPGPAGPQGATGPAGPAGVAGAMGLPGPPGQAGPIGLTGASGPPGAPGAAGLSGTQGPPGQQGIAGPQGPAGAPVASLSDLDGIACTVNGIPATIVTSVNAKSGGVSLVCGSGGGGSCGDGVVNPAAGEQCDSGGVDTATCNGLTCTPPTCGDGYTNLAAGEQCDTKVDTSVCIAATCRVSKCGDGYTNVLAGEQCDLGAQNSDTGCCSLTCQNLCGP
jgi:hypothetical protein